MPKIEIVAGHQPGDTVYWVHDNYYSAGSGKHARVIKGTILDSIFNISTAHNAVR